MSDENGIVFRDNNLYAMTASGPVRLTSDQPTRTLVGVDYGSEPSRTVVTTTCARCSATIDPAAVEQHHERCLRVGDWLRLDCSYSGGSWVEGPIVTLSGDDGHAAISPERASPDMRCRVGGDPFTFSPKRLDGIRRIQRPGQAVREAQERYVLSSPFDPGTINAGDIPMQDTPMHFTVGSVYRLGEMQAVAIDHSLSPHASDAEIKALLEAQGGKVGWSDEQPTLSARLGHLKHGPGGSGLAGPCDADCRKCEVERDAELQDAMERVEPTLIDGLTAMECYMRWCDNRACVERGGRPLYDLTPAQIAEGRATYQYDLAVHWSLNLRARISAAKERERLSVTYCEMDVDVDD